MRYLRNVKLSVGIGIAMDICVYCNKSVFKKSYQIDSKQNVLIVGYKEVVWNDNQLIKKIPIYYDSLIKDNVFTSLMKLKNKDNH